MSEYTLKVSRPGASELEEYPTRLPFKVWGLEGVDGPSIQQMCNAVSIPPAVAGALMPDAHLGYGLPIGGVLALDNAVCPYAVGVDIACRMKLSIFPISSLIFILEQDTEHLAKILEDNTYFGVGVERQDNDHDIAGWGEWFGEVVVQQNRDKALRQLGTSGSGNHFVEWGIVTIPQVAEQKCFSMDLGPHQNSRNCTLGQINPGKYLALMSHSGSRGTGASVCNEYSKMAKRRKECEAFGDLAWFSLDSQIGKDYWFAMNLMGEYARANHDVIHREIAKALGTEPMLQIENHHNFAWKEVHHGRELIVHRKGATPAGKGELGIIPGSMGTPAYVVKGKGNPDSLCSASHGAGRVMSRTQAKKTFNYREEIDRLAERGITVLSAGADEVVGVYKDIDQVMAAQSDLVETVARFDPKIVKMCGTKDRAED